MEVISDSAVGSNTDPPASQQHKRTRRFQAKARSAGDQHQLRQRFIEHGRQLLNTAPDGEVSLRQIARQAGYSPSALYRYFPTKAALVYAVREDHLRLSTQHARELAEAEADPHTRLCVGFEAMVDFWHRHPQDFQRLFNYCPAPPEGSGLRMAESDVSTEARRLKEELVEGLFSAHRVELSADLRKLLTDSMMVASHGVISVPMGSPSLSYWSPPQLASSVIKSLSAGWLAFIRDHGPTRPGQPAAAVDYLRFCERIGRGG